MKKVRIILIFAEIFALYFLCRVSTHIYMCNSDTASMDFLFILMYNLCVTVDIILNDFRYTEEYRKMGAS